MARIRFKNNWACRGPRSPGHCVLIVGCGPVSDPNCVAWVGYIHGTLDFAIRGGRSSIARTRTVFVDVAYGAGLHACGSEKYDKSHSNQYDGESIEMSTR